MYLQLRGKLRVDLLPIRRDSSLFRMPRNRIWNMNIIRLIHGSGTRKIQKWSSRVVGSTMLEIPDDQSAL